MVEDEGGGQPEPGGGVEPVAQFYRGEGVEAQVGEGLPRVDGLRGGVAQHGGHVAADQVEDAGVLVGLGPCGQPLGQGGGLIAGRR